MSGPILVDSSWYIGAMKNRVDPISALWMHSESRKLCTCGTVLCEVGRGITHMSTLAKFERALGNMLYIESSSERWEATLRLAWEMNRKGRAIPLPDIHIAACALDVGAAVLTLDKHFAHVPGLRVASQLI